MSQAANGVPSAQMVIAMPLQARSCLVPPPTVSFPFCYDWVIGILDFEADYIIGICCLKQNRQKGTFNSGEGMFYVLTCSKSV